MGRPFDWLRSGSPREFAASIIEEAVRRTKLAAKSDPDFGRAADDVSTILASRHFVLPPTMPERAVDEASAVLATRVFGRGVVGAGTGHRLTFGTHLTGGSYDGSADVALGTDAVSTNTANTLVSRDNNGDFAMRNLTAVLISGLLTTANQSNITALGSLTALKLDTGVPLKVFAGGAADCCGTAGMSAGTVTVNTTAVTAKSKILVTRKTPSGTLGHIDVGTRVNGTSFTITSSSATEASTFDWLIVETYP